MDHTTDNPFNKNCTHQCGRQFPPVQEELEQTSTKPTQKHNYQQFPRSINRLSWQSQQTVVKPITVQENGIDRHIAVSRVAVAPLINSVGPFWHFSFHLSDVLFNYQVIVKATLARSSLSPLFGRDSILLHLNKGCMPNQIGNGFNCGCGDPLINSMSMIEESGRDGIIVCIPRQINQSALWNQIKLGLYTLEAECSFFERCSEEYQSYSGTIGILKFFGLHNNSHLSIINHTQENLNMFQENSLEYQVVSSLIEEAPQTRKYFDSAPEYTQIKRSNGDLG